MRPVNRKAFTLIELLVVISIIALLVSILLPAMGKAREMAKFSICATNEHQVGLAIYLYGVENKGRITPGDCSRGTTVQEFLPYFTGPTNLGHLISAKFLPVPTSVNHVFFCPSDRYDRYNGWPVTLPISTNGRWFRDRWNVPQQTWIDFGYEFRDSMDGCWDASYSVQQRKTLRGAPYDKITRHVIMSDFYSWGQTDVMHKRKYNVLTGDGTVRAVDDRRYKTTLRTPADPRIIGFTNYILSGNQAEKVIRDYLDFDALDLLFGFAYLPPPPLAGQPAALLPLWRK